MKRAGWRTTLAYRLRMRWRRLLVAWYDLQATVEDWWARHVVAAEPPKGLVVAIPWDPAAADRPWRRDGRADVLVMGLAPDGSELWNPTDMIEVYLHLIHRLAPREVIG